MHEQHERYSFACCFEFCSQREDVLIDFIEHADYHVDIGFGLEGLSGGSCGVYPYEGGRVRHVQADVFFIDLRFDFAVFFHDESVIVAAYHEYSLDPELDKRIEICILEIFGFRCVVHGL